jgi:hypothetical protein
MTIPIVVLGPIEGWNGFNVIAQVLGCVGREDVAMPAEGSAKCRGGAPTDVRSFTSDQHRLHRWPDDATLFLLSPDQAHQPEAAT